MALIAERWGLIPELRSFTAAERPVWGTCAGLIFLADRATGVWPTHAIVCSLLPRDADSHHGVRAHEEAVGSPARCQCLFAVTQRQVLFQGTII